ncbi:hypothetical protein HDU87_006698 [Geranomyces variabilis]|uniref:Uncharacterized protein n=1 Tax=Geranomyces variabilis TaxID=109894 RepID=A0AAD5TPP0_9FUNG|nr:hypothetical protein HDU87_006698 [Geranomyces variabilis]
MTQPSATISRMTAGLSLSLRLPMVPARAALASTSKRSAPSSAFHGFVAGVSTGRYFATEAKSSAAASTAYATSSSEAPPRRSNDLPNNVHLFRKFNKALDKGPPLEQWHLYGQVCKAGDAKFMSLFAFKKILECIRNKRPLSVKSDERRLELTNDLWKALKDSSVSMDVQLLSTLLQVYGRLGDLSGVNAVLSELKAMRIKVDSRNYQTWVMMAYAKSGMQAEARAIYDNFKGKIGHDAALPNLYLFGIVNGAEPARLDVALSLFKEMKTDGPKPDNNTYNHIIALYGRLGKADEMLAWFEKRRSEIRSEPPTAIYNQVLWGLINVGRWQDARDLLDQMAERGVLPDRRTANRAVMIADHFGDPVLGWKYCGLADGNGSESTNVHTLGRLAKLAGPAMAGQEGFEKFTTILGAVDTDIEPRILARLVKGYCQNGDGASATAVLTWFPITGFKPDASVYTSIISTYIKNNELDAAKALASSWPPADTPIAAWTRIMLAFKRVGDNDVALSILEMYAPSSNFFPRDLVDTLEETYGRDDELYKASARVLRDKIAERAPKSALDS